MIPGVSLRPDGKVAAVLSSIFGLGKLGRVIVMNLRLGHAQPGLGLIEPDERLGQFVSGFAESLVIRGLHHARLDFPKRVFLGGDFSFYYNDQLKLNLEIIISNRGRK
jgi:hypothetical protein